MEANLADIIMEKKYVKLLLNSSYFSPSKKVGDSIRTVEVLNQFGVSSDINNIWIEFVSHPKSMALIFGDEVKNQILPKKFAFLGPKDYLFF